MINLHRILLRKITYVFLLAVVLSVSQHCRADDPHFIINDLPDGWVGRAESGECEKVDSSDAVRCSGLGYVHLSRGSYLLSLQSDDLIFSAKNGSINEPLSPVLFEDFNYDGLPDIAVRNGSNGNYGAPSHDIYTVTPDGSYMRNEALTELAQNYLGLPELIDPESKILRVFARNGCCERYADDFKVLPNGKMQKVRMFRLYTDPQTGEWKEIESRLINGKWREGKPQPWTGRES